uniref:Uncharacterized protein n=1 Tax=Otus sunia TaxID=257818 RepID=A0A8C8BJZ7_9STRI
GFKSLLPPYISKMCIIDNTMPRPKVVKMRKDVKKARVLTIRRLTRHIGKLKLKRGSEDLKVKNQKRVERLIEEIHAMKVIPCLDI